MKPLLIVSGVLACISSMLFALVCMGKGNTIFSILSLIGSAGGMFLAVGLLTNMLELKQ